MDPIKYSKERENLDSIVERSKKAEAAYNPELKVIAYRKNDVGNDYFQNRLLKKICCESEKRQEDISDINKKTKYLTKRSCPIEGFVLENIFGYQRI